MRAHCSSYPLTDQQVQQSPARRAAQQAVDALPHAFWEASICKLLQAGHCLRPGGHSLYRRAAPDALLDTARLAWGVYSSYARGESILVLPQGLEQAVHLRPHGSVFLVPLQLCGGPLLDVERAELLLSDTGYAHVSDCSPDGRWVFLEGNMLGGILLDQAYDLLERTSCSLRGTRFSQCGRYSCRVDAQTQHAPHCLNLSVFDARSRALLASACVFEGPLFLEKPNIFQQRLELWSQFSFVATPLGSTQLLRGSAGNELLVCNLSCEVLLKLSKSGTDFRAPVSSPSGQQLFIVDNNGLLLHAFSTTTWQAEAPELPLQPPDETFVFLRFGPTCALWLLQRLVHGPISLQLMGTAPGASRALIPVQLPPQTERFNTHTFSSRLSFSPCGRWLALGKLENSVPTICFISTKTGALLRIWSAAEALTVPNSERGFGSLMFKLRWTALRRLVFKIGDMLSAARHVYVVALE